MCFNCGCRIPQDDMGNSDNIHTAMLENLAKKWQMDLVEVKRLFLAYAKDEKVGEKESELKQIFEKAANAWGQPVEEAKTNSAKILADS